ncbi:nephrin-like [Macrobrachium rosenbergii]|uniref:nephrin-like n=1 Tax=Macrobrachium rosenbergii TaxID=79674 RepID=UPI0034D7AEA0
MPVDTNSTFVDSVGVVNTYSMVPTKEDDGVQYECVVAHELLEEPLIVNITLTVYYPPSYVSLTGPSQVEEGGSVWLTCESSESNPSSTLTWSVQGKEVTTAKSSVGQVSSGGWVTSSDLTQYVVRAGLVPEITVECKASNPAFQKYASKTLVIAVTKPPGPPSWETDLGREVVSGATLDLSCSSVGGTPPPTLRIYKEDDVLPTKLEKKGNMTRASSLIKITASDNGSKLTCEVSSLATRMPLTTSARLSVLFGPSETKGWMAPYQVEEGALFNLFCESSSSLPPSNITWNIEGMVVVEPSVDFYPAVFGGTSTRSHKQMRAAASDDGRLVGCSAHNGVGAPAPTNFTLRVLHAPIWIKAPSPQINVQENSHVVITALAKSNPGPPSYRWQRGKDLLQGRDELQLEKVRRTQSGNYSVSAVNERGNISASFYLNVQYGPEVLPPTDRVTVEGGGSVSVKCIARANPPARVIWSRTPHFQKNNKTQILSSGIGKAELVLRKIKPEDTGVYYCQAANLVGYSLPVKTKIIVLQAVTAVDNGNSISWSSPDVYGGGSSSSLASDGMSLGVPAGGLGRLECLVRAAPQPTFVWSGRGGLILFKSDKYFIHEPQLVDGLVTWRSVLEIRRVTQEDFAQYKCSASNKLGSQTIQLSLTTPSHPHQPNNLNVARISSSGVSLTWTPNFSGGQPDGYTIKYRPSGETRYQYAEVPGGHMTKTTVDKLLPDTEYSFTVQATNHFGTSPYSPAIYVHTLEGPSKEPTTLKEASQNTSSRFPGNWTQAGAPGIGGTEGGGARTLTHARSGVPRLLLLLMILTGTAFLIINTAIIACFVQRRAHNRRQRMLSSTKSSVIDLGGEGTSGGSATSPNHGDVLLSLTTRFSNSFSRSPVFCQEDQQRTEETANFTTFSTISAPPLTPLLNGGVITSDTTLLTISTSRQRNSAIKQRSSFLSKSSGDAVVMDTSLSATFAQNDCGGIRGPEKPKERVDYSSIAMNYFPTEPDACSQSSSVYDNASSPHLSTKNTSVHSDSSAEEEEDEEDDDDEEENEEEEEEEEEEQDDLFSLRSISSNTSRTYRPSLMRPLVSSLGLRDELHVKCLPSPEVQLKVPTTDEVQHRLQEHIQKDLDLHKMQQQQQQAAFAKSQEYSSLRPAGVNNLTSGSFNARCPLSSFASGSPPQYTTLQGLRLPSKAVQPRTAAAVTNEYEYGWAFPLSGGSPRGNRLLCMKSWG